jgi:hypothetical protein
MVVEHDDGDAGPHGGDGGIDTLIEKGGHCETLLALQLVAINVSGRTPDNSRFRVRNRRRALRLLPSGL